MPVFGGSEFLVNTTTLNNQRHSAVTALADGRFVVTWTDGSRTGGDTSDAAIRGQIFTASGAKIGGEFLVNTTTTNTQYSSAVTALADGRFAVTWSDISESGGDTNGMAVRCQIFTSEGVKSGGEFLVNTTTTSTQYENVVAPLLDGRFVVTWTDGSASAGDTSGKAIRGQIFTSAGVKSGVEFLVNTTATNNQYESAITALADGRFLVTWTDLSLSGSDVTGSAIRGQIFTASGTKSGAEFLVNTTTSNDQSASAVTALDGGGFVVTWSDLSQSGGDTSFYAVRGQIFTSAGVKSGAEFRVNTSTLNSQEASSVTALADGRFVVTWTDGSTSGGDTSSTAIRGQIFTSSGIKSGAEFLVNTTTSGTQTESAVSALADGRFIVTWSDGSVSSGDLSSDAVRSRIFDATIYDGHDGVDVVYGGNLADRIVGYGGVDTLSGGAENDYIHGGRSSDTLNGDAGNDRLFGGVDGDFLFGGIGDDRLYGEAGIDQLNGGEGDDVLDGGAEGDQMAGALGDDLYGVNNAGDVVTEALNGGTDRVNAVIDYTLGTNVETLYLYGTANFGRGNALANTIVGSANGDALYGEAGNDAVYGANGNDYLRGGLGADQLYGGLNNDGFVFDTTLGATNIDTIMDFVAVNDTIWLNDSIFTGLTPGMLAANLYKTIGAGGVLDADDRIAYDISTGKLYYDQNGAAAGGWAQFATLITKPALSAVDFIVF
jgi:hypothetical protein